MQITSLKGFRHSEEEEGIVPSLIDVELTSDEALFLAKFVGGTSANQREEIMRGGGDLGADIYDTLAGDLFNRFYDAGVDGAVRARGKWL